LARVAPGGVRPGAIGALGRGRQRTLGVGSPGPRPASAKSQSPHAPRNAQTWYRRAGDTGVIVRFADRDGVQRKSP